VVKKKLPVKWDSEALEDLKSIYKYIKKDSPANADKVRKELIRLAGTLSLFPEKYSKEPLLEVEKGDFRFIIKWNYKIIYEITNKEVIITFIFHTSQNPTKIKKVK
jgi:addiction module RelE/StbE family toxin